MAYPPRILSILEGNPFRELNPRRYIPISVRLAEIRNIELQESYAANQLLLSYPEVIDAGTFYVFRSHVTALPHGHPNPLPRRRRFDARGELRLAERLKDCLEDNAWVWHNIRN